MKVPQHFIHKKCQPSPQFTMDKGNRCCSSIFFWFKFFLWLLRRKRVEKLLHSTARSNNWIMWYVKNYTLPDAFFFKASVRELYFLPLLWKLSQQEKHFCFFAHRIQIVTHQLRFMLTHSYTVMKILTDFVMKAKWAVATVKNAVLTIQLHSVSLLWLSEEWLPCSHLCVPELWPIPLFKNF